MVVDSLSSGNASSLVDDFATVFDIFSALEKGILLDLVARGQRK